MSSRYATSSGGVGVGCQPGWQPTHVPKKRPASVAAGGATPEQQQRPVSAAAVAVTEQTTRRPVSAAARRRPTKEWISAHSTVWENGVNTARVPMQEKMQTRGYGSDDWCAPLPVAPPSPWRAVVARSTPQSEPQPTLDPRGGKGTARLIGGGAHAHGAFLTSNHQRDADIGRAERHQRRVPPGCVTCAEHPHAYGEAKVESSGSSRARTTRAVWARGVTTPPASLRAPYAVTPYAVRRS